MNIRNVLTDADTCFLYFEAPVDLFYFLLGKFT